MSDSKRNSKSERLKREQFIETIAQGVWEEIIGNYDGGTWNDDLTYEEQGSCRSTARGAIELVLTYLSNPDNISEEMGKGWIMAYDEDEPSSARTIASAMKEELKAFKKRRT